LEWGELALELTIACIDEAIEEGSVIADELHVFVEGGMWGETWEVSESEVAFLNECVFHGIELFGG